MKFREIAQSWMASKEDAIQKDTFEIYRAAMDNTILPYLGEMEEISEEDMRSFLGYLSEQGIKTTSFYNYVQKVKSILTFGAKRGWCAAPLWSFSLTGKDKRSAKQNVLLTPREEQKLVRYLMKYPFPFNIAMLLTLFCGLRIDEIAELLWGEIDLEKGLLKVVQHPGASMAEKGAEKLKARIIPLPESVVQYLRPYAALATPTTYVVTGTSVPAARIRTFRDRLHKITDDLALPAVTFQDLRHTFTIRCIESGCDFVVLADLLGYANVQRLYDDYKPYFKNDKRAAMKGRVGKLLVK